MWVCCFDLETIPCLESLARLHGLDQIDDQTAEGLLGGKFPKLPLHKIVVLGSLWGEFVDGSWEVRSLDVPHIGQVTEAQMISDFSAKLLERRPTLVSFNGNGFDLPVLRYRAMINGIAAPGIQDEYFKRYSTLHVDLCDHLANYEARGKIGLDDLSKMMGLPGKPEGIDGSKVWQAVREGRIQHVANYCASDVGATFELWRIYEGFRGRS